MTRILIPASHSKLLELVENCLFSLQAQGFDIDEVALVHSSTPWIELVQNHSTTAIASDLLAPLDTNSDYSFVLCYYADLSPEACAKQLDKAIFIGIADKKKLDEKGNPTQLDIWRHGVPDTSSNTASNAENQSSNEVRALASQLNLNFNPELHLAWFIALSAIDFPIEDVLTLARAITTQQSNVSRETSTKQNLNRDRLALSACQFGDFPTPLLEDKRLGIDVGWVVERESIHFAHLAKSSLGLYPVVDDVTWIERLLPLGIKTIQLRIKDPQQADLEQQIIDAIKLGRQYKAQVFINDYWQLAIKHGAFGVHLGQEDIEQANLGQLAKANIHLGLSTHGYYELLRIVQIHPSYIALGHIFATTTKQMPSKPQGLIRLALYQKLIDTIPYGKNSAQCNKSQQVDSQVKLGYPTVAIGGIDSSNAAQVWQCGVSSLAVVRAITQAKSPQAVIEFFSELIQTKQNRERP